MPKLKPSGNNELNSKYSYYQREFYEESVDEVLQQNPQLSLIDLQQKTLYGKVDLNNKIVAPQPNKTVSFQGSFRTFDFIAEALTDLTEKIDARLNNGTMRRTGPYANLEVSNQNANWRDEYVAYLAQIQEAYTTRFMDTPAKRNEIKNFRQFVTSFLDFSTASSPGFPMTFSKYYVSRHSGIFPTGFAFDISREKYGDDLISFTRYFEDVNFKFFAQEAQNHGFIIDRHAPYRLVANLTSKPMKKYMQRSGHMNVSEMFDNLFFSPMKAEFYEIVKMISFMYSEAYPPGSTYAQICYQDGKTSYSLKERETFQPQNFRTLDELVSHNGYAMWLRIYSFMKAREVNMNLTQREFDDIVDKAVNLNKFLDIDAALVYINDKFNPLFVSDYNKKPNFRF